MKIKDVIVEQEKPGLLRRAAGAIGRHVYSAATGKAYREPKKPVEPAAVQQQTAPAQAAPAQQTTVDQNNILDNIKIASSDPLIYQLDKTQYHVNNRGNWAKFPGEREVGGTVAALLDKAAKRDNLL